jgi:Family of unknown function (DUF6199)
MNSGNSPPLLFYIILVLAATTALFPRAAWFFNEGWKFKNAEPSDAAIFVTRLGGIIAVVVILYILNGGGTPASP